MSEAKNGIQLCTLGLVMLLMMTMLSSVYWQEQNNIYLKDDGTPVPNYMKQKGITYYRFEVDSEYNKKDDLIITVNPASQNDDPDLFISLKNSKPHDMNTSDFIWAMVGGDTCTVPYEYLKPEGTVYIGVKWYKACEYSISGQIQPEQEVKSRIDYNITVGELNSKIVSFHNTAKDAHTLVFTARSSRKDAKIKMFVSTGKDEAPSSDDTPASEGWVNGIVLRLTDKTPVKVKNDEYYKLLIQSDKTTTIDFRVDIVYTEKVLQNGVAIEDFVNFNDRTCYKYFVRSPEQTLRVGAYSYSGNPDIYVNPKEILEENNKFAFNATSPGDDVLVITSKDREKANNTKGLYYIWVKGNSNVSYRIRVVESDKEYYLEDGISETTELENGKDHTYYYTDEALKRNLNLTFTLSIKSGITPKMKIKFCGRVLEERCFISDSDKNLIGGRREIGKVYAFIKHSGNSCKGDTTNQDKPCIYAIEVSVPNGYSRDHITHFSLLAQHNETSHIRLREGIALEQIIENHEVKYYRFHVRDSSVEEVTFSLNNHHGDADLYVSRVNKYPDNTNYELKSDKSRRFVDQVIFKDLQNSTSIGRYYIGVKGYEYSSFSIIASVKRQGENDTIVPIQLSEGISLADHLSSNGKKYYQFKTYMYGDSVSPIKISVNEYSGSAKFYVGQGKIPTEEQYDYASENGQDLIINHEDKKFKPVGMKYILVVPTKRNTAKNIRYTIEWTTKTSISKIKINMPIFDSVQYGEHYAYYKYVVIEKQESYTISLTSLSGDPNLIVSIDPHNPLPTIENHKYHSKKEGSDSIFVERQDLASMNPSCRSSGENLLGAEPCEIYIAVYCAPASGSFVDDSDSCAYSLKLYPDNENMHMLVDGMPQKDSVRQTSSLYYYVNINKDIDSLYIASSAIIGDIGMYVKFNDFDQKDDEIDLPAEDDVPKEAKHIGHSQLIHFSNKEVLKYCGDIKDCVAIISIQGLDAVEFNDFYIVAYTSLPKLVPNTPMIGKASEETMMYYTYTSYCDKWDLIVSASAYSIDADLDLYINVGSDKDLPSTDKYDIKSSLWFSEVEHLHLEHKYFKEKKIKSMKQVFLIGVYAKQETTFSIEIEETDDIKRLKTGRAVEADQNKNDVKVFAYYHKENKSFKFELTMLRGDVEVYIGTYQQFADYKPEHHYLPKDKDDALWSMDSKSNSTIKITEEDENFWYKCVYIVGIKSNKGGAKYILEVQTQNIAVTKYGKIGVPIKDQVKKDETKEYIFVLDRNNKFRINASLYMGKFTYSVSNEKNSEKAIKTSSHDKFIEIDGKDLEKFEEGENIYVRVMGAYDHSEFVVLVTHHESFSILPDSLPQEFAINPYQTDPIKLMYYPPAVQNKIKLQINMYVEGVTCDVYMKGVFIKNITERSLEFPIERETEYKVGQWDKNRLLLSGEKEVNNERDDEYVYLITLIPKISDHDLAPKKDIRMSVSFSAQEVDYLLPNREVEGYLLEKTNQTRYYKFFVNGVTDIDIILTSCVCDHNAIVYKTLENAYDDNEPEARTTLSNNGIKTLSINSASGPYYLRIVLKGKHDGEEIGPEELCVFSIKFVDKNSPTYKYSLNDYTTKDNGIIGYEFVGRDQIQLTWPQIYKESARDSEELPDTTKSAYLLKKDSENMNSIWGINHAIDRNRAFLIKDGIGEKEYVVDLNEIDVPKDWGKDWIDEQDYLTFTGLAYVNREGAAIPFIPVTVENQFYGSYRIPAWVYILLILIMGGLLFAIFYFRKKAKKIQMRLDFEMNDIRNVARVGFPSLKSD